MTVIRINPCLPASTLLSGQKLVKASPSRRWQSRAWRNAVHARVPSTTVGIAAVTAPVAPALGPAPAPAQAGVLSSDSQREATCQLQYADISELIDVQRPYYALFDVSAPGTLQTSRIGMPVSGKFRTESAMGREEGIPIGAGELARHCAVLGSIACAAANPVKQKHYYLAARAGHQLLEDALDEGNTRRIQPKHGASHELGVGSVFQAVATCHKFQTGLARAAIMVDMITTTGEAKPYAKFDCTYVVSDEAAFQETVSRWTQQLPPLTHQQTLSASTLSSLDCNPYADTLSPYSNPISIGVTDNRPEDGSREGLLNFDNPGLAAGHFRGTPALPASIVISNVVQCVSFLHDGPFVVRSLDLKCRRCALLGELLRVRASQVKPGGVKASVMSAASGEEIITFTMDLSF